MMETFVPLYISNHCDSCCLMCNLHRNNKNITRVEASLEVIEQQLKIIYNYERVHAVCFLTGERYLPLDREYNLRFVIESMHLAIKQGFERVFFNIGSLNEYEVSIIHDSFRTSKRANLVFSLFQETYDHVAYAKYFGKGDHNPKSDFCKRLASIDHWLNRGFSTVDIGILLGFKREFESDVEMLLQHARKLTESGVEVYISTPRIKDGTVDDETYQNILFRFHDALPSAKLIITTREKISFINSLIDVIDVVSPGSSDICPYSYGEFLSNDLLTSQFVIEEKRLRPFVVLSKLNCQQIRYFYPSE